MGGNVAEAEGDVGPDFFGLPAQTPVYHGVGGMHAIATGLLRAAVPRGQDAQIKVEIKVGARVASIRRIDAGEHAGRWQLLGTTGDAALHDSTEAVAAQALEEPCSHLFFDALLVTDASASFEGWHRASAGLPACASKVRDQVRQRVRVPLFTALIAFEKRVAVDLDAITFADQTLWFAARSVSKQGLHPQAPGQGAYLCLMPASHCHVCSLHAGHVLLHAHHAACYPYARHGGQREEAGRCSRHDRGTRGARVARAPRVPSVGPGAQGR